MTAALPPLAADDPLATPVRFLPGVGDRRAAMLHRLGLRTAADVLFNLPKDALDLTTVVAAGDLKEGDRQTVRGRLVDRDSRSLGGRKTLTKLLLDCDGVYVAGVWFNQPWVLRKYADDAELLFTAKPKFRQGRWEFPNPDVEVVESEADDAGEADDAESEDGEGPVEGDILPRYRLTEGLTLSQMRRISRAAAERFADAVTDPVPDEIVTAASLPPLDVAVRELHAPTSIEAFGEARRRMIFDDLLAFQLGLAVRRRAYGAEGAAPRIEVSAKVDARIRRLFPFAFTAGQDEAVRQIVADVGSPRAMHRLLQADVGAGKTVVALYAMLAAIAGGYQAVLMAPTAVLARQHWLTVERALADSRVRRRLLIGDVTAAERKRNVADVASGAVDLIVGTQAVIQDDVTFARLGVAVVDEQHKFGVAQRARFASAASTSSLSPPAGGEGRGEGGTAAGRETSAGTMSGDSHGEESTAVSQTADGTPSSAPDGAPSPPGRGGREAVQPHVLVMTATPIPRSLCLTRFGDLDVTTVRDRPPGRREISTSRVTGARGRAKMWVFVREQLTAGRQAYVICPRVEADDDDREAAVPASVEAAGPLLSAGELKEVAGSDPVAVATIHGRLSPEDKEARMADFRDGRTRVLISTTVVEVGVDVPNATVMVILRPERFGLSQLHQLRGRVGRGSRGGYCFLLPENESEEASARLSVLERTNDGFKVAEDDAELRGPGDVLGTRQSGGMPLRVADLSRDAKVLTEARAAAFEWVASGAIDRPGSADLRRIVWGRFGEALELPPAG